MMWCKIVAANLKKDSVNVLAGLIPLILSCWFRKCLLPSRKMNGYAATYKLRLNHFFFVMRLVSQTDSVNWATAQNWDLYWISDSSLDHFILTKKKISISARSKPNFQGWYKKYSKNTFVLAVSRTNYLGDRKVFYAFNTHFRNQLSRI